MTLVETHVYRSLVLIMGLFRVLRSWWTVLDEKTSFLSCARVLEGIRVVVGF